MRFKSLQTNNKLNTHYVEFKNNIVTYTRKTPIYTLRATLKITYIDGDDVLKQVFKF